MPALMLALMLAFMKALMSELILALMSELILSVKLALTLMLASQSWWRRTRDPGSNLFTKGPSPFSFSLILTVLSSQNYNFQLKRLHGLANQAVVILKPNDTFVMNVLPYILSVVLALKLDTV